MLLENGLLQEITLCTQFANIYHISLDYGVLFSELCPNVALLRNIYHSIAGAKEFEKFLLAFHSHPNHLLSLFYLNHLLHDTQLNPNKPKATAFSIWHRSVHPHAEEFDDARDKKTFFVSLLEKAKTQERKN